MSSKTNENHDFFNGFDGIFNENHDFSIKITNSDGPVLAHGPFSMKTMTFL